MLKTEKEILKVHPVLFRSHPAGFVILGFIILAGLVSIFDEKMFLTGLAFIAVPILIIANWWLKSISVTMTITDTQTTVRRGLLSKQTNSVRHADVRNTVVSQGIFDRMLGVGKIEIASAGHGGVEITVSGIKAPERIREYIDQYR